MAYTSNDTNMTGSAGLSAGLQTYYNRKLLETFEPNLVHTQFATMYPLPANNGKVMQMRKFTPIPANTKALTEGNPGAGKMLAETSVTVEVKQYGDYAAFTDFLDMTHMDVNVAKKVELLGNAGARSLDALVRDELATCTNVIYAGGKSSRSALTAADKLTSKELRKAVRTLKKGLAQPFGGYFVAIVGPDVIYDLQDDEAFVKVSAYQDKENIYTGEVGRLYGVRFVETTEAKVFTGAGASGADVASVIVLGQDAYGMTGVGGKTAPHVIVKPAGSAGTNDPLDQINTVGWKLDGFAVKLLQSEYAVRIECGFSQ